PTHDLGKKRIGGSCMVLRHALTIERPAKDRGFAAMSAEPFVHQGGLAGAAGSNDLNKVGGRIGPGSIQKFDLLVAANQQGVDGGKFGSKSSMCFCAARRWGEQIEPLQYVFGNLIIRHFANVE